MKMINENISQLKVYWLVTYDETNSDFPTDVELELRNKYFEKHKELPYWHNKLQNNFN